MKKNVLYLLIALWALQLHAQKLSIWKTISVDQTSRLTRVIEHKNTIGEKYYVLDVHQMKQSLVSVSDVHSGNVGTIVSIPNLNGDLEQFEIWENSNFDPALQAAYPEIRAYTGRGITDRSANINFSLAPIGFQTAVFRAGKDAEFIEAFDKQASVYVLFNSKNSHSGTSTFKCGVEENGLNFTAPAAITNRSSAGQLKTMRLAASCNGEYAQHFGGTVVGALSGLNASLTRMNALFERDLAIHLNLIANNDILIYLDPATDPFSPGNIGSANDVWNNETQNNLNTVLGNAAYDVGHLFCKTGGGGNAGCIGCVCIDSAASNDRKKGAGFTAPESNTAAPSGDVFDYDFLAHEFGHQFGATHTFSYAFEGTGTNVEPGSGCATMAYAGVTNWDVQPHNIIQFASTSVNQVQINMSGKTCPVDTPTSVNPYANDAPAATIPKGTAFILSSTGTDPDAGDILSYSWEQNDGSDATTEGANSITTDTKLVGPTFRLYTATSSPVRYMPKLEYVLNGQLTNPTNWESVSNVARDLHFSFIVRDNHPGGGQTDIGATTVSVVTTSGPFTVSSQNTTGISWSGGSTQTITWDVNNTTALAGSSNVNVMLSTDGGLTFPTTLASGVPNNGSTTVTVPNIAAALCRIMIKPTGNIYYAVNSNAFAIVVNYTITANAGANGSITPSGVTSVVSGANQTYTITANAGYTVADVLIDGISVGAVTTYTFTSVVTDHTISATFVVTTTNYTITASAGANGSISPNAATTVVSGANQTYTITPNTCYQIADVLVDGISVGTVGTYTFTNVTANHTIAASFNSSATTYYQDADNDGFGNPANTTQSCVAVVGYVLNNTDCNDAAPTVYPGATELCYDGLDNNCNGTIDEGCTPIVSVVQPAQCGITLAAIDSDVFANLVSNVQGYRFRVTNLTTNLVQTIDRNLRVFKITQLPVYAFNTTYQVEVAVKKNNVWQPFFGSPCTVSTPATSTQLQSAQCGATISSLADVIYANNVPYATGYRFRVINLSNGSETVLVRSLREFRMNLLSSPMYNTTYSVAVAIRNTDGTYLPYGPICNITTPSFPTTQLQASQCGYIATSNTETIFANAFTSATAYRFKISNAALGYMYSIDRSLRTFSLNLIPGLQAGTTYTVEVSLKINGVFGPFGTACTVTTPGIVRIETKQTNPRENSISFKATAYPNPFAADFKLNVTTSSEELVQLRVYDMLGKLVENKQVAASELENLEVGASYPSGVYNVVVSQGENTQTLRVIKR